MNTYILPLTAAHLAGVAALEALCFPDEPWSEAALRTTFLDSDRATARVVCDEAGNVLAYAGMTYAAGEGSVTDVAVHPDARRRGFGRAAVEALVDAARALGLTELYLEVRPSNTPARELYSSLGFSEIGRRKNFYRAPTEDALMMKKQLS